MAKADKPERAGQGAGREAGRRRVPGRPPAAARVARRPRRRPRRRRPRRAARARSRRGSASGTGRPWCRPSCRSGVPEPHQAPRLVKIVINMGLSEAKENAKALDFATADMVAITGQKAVVTKAKKSIAAFKVRTGMPVGPRRRSAARGCTSSWTASSAWPFRGRDFGRVPSRSTGAELRARAQGADHLPGDRLRQDRQGPRDGHHHLHDRRDGRGSEGPPDAPRRRSASRRRASPWPRRP